MPNMGIDIVNARNIKTCNAANATVKPCKSTRARKKKQNRLVRVVDLNAGGRAYELLSFSEAAEFLGCTLRDVRRAYPLKRVIRGQYVVGFGTGTRGARWYHPVNLRRDATTGEWKFFRTNIFKAEA